MRIGVAVLFACALLISACNSRGCLENRNSLPLAGFYNAYTEKPLALDSVEVIGLGMPAEQPLYSVGERPTTAYLPMRSTQNSTSWLFKYRKKALDFDANVDTLSFVYESTPYFASSDCGVIYKYLITEMTCTDHIIERVEIVDSLITNVDIQRIKIFFRVDEEEQ